MYNSVMDLYLKYYHQYLSYILYTYMSVINYKIHSIISFIIKKKKMYSHQKVDLSVMFIILFLFLFYMEVLCL